MLRTYLGLADTPMPAEAIDSFGQHRPVLASSSSISRKPGRLVLCPGAEFGPAKQWPAAYFSEVARYWLSRDPTHSLAIIGGPKDIEIGGQIDEFVSQGLPERRADILNLCGKTSLQEAFAEIEKADCVISNDSGLMHAAAALDVPVIALFGSTDPHHTPPHSSKATVLSLGLPCSPCFSRTCPLGTTACLKELGPERVISVLARVQAAQP